MRDAITLFPLLMMFVAGEVMRKKYPYEETKYESNQYMMVVK